MKAGSVVAGALVVAGGSASADLLVTPTEFVGRHTLTSFFSPVAQSATDEDIFNQPVAAGRGSSRGFSYALQSIQRDHFYFRDVPPSGIVNRVRLTSSAASHIEMVAEAPDEVLFVSLTSLSAGFEVDQPVKYTLFGSIEISEAQLVGEGLGAASVSAVLLRPGQRLHTFELAGFEEDRIDFQVSGELSAPGEYFVAIATSASAWTQTLGSSIDSASFADITLEFAPVPTPGGLGVVLGGAGLIVSRRRR